MRIHPVRIAVIVLLAALLVGSIVQAQSPGTMVYQGRLLNASGVPITAATSVAFRIYSVVSGGTALWTETRSVTPDANGVFTIELGTTTPMTPTIFGGTVRYLGITVGAETEMTPRQALSAVPYAFRAGVAAAPATIEGVANNGDNIDVVPGAGLTVTGNDGANTITITPAAGGMHPIAWGLVNSGGTIGNAGSGNWTVEWNTTNSQYEITIAGVTYNYARYLTFVTGLGGARMWNVGSISGRMAAIPYNSDGTTRSQAYFYFLIYDLPAAAKLGEAEGVDETSTTGTQP